MPKPPPISDEERDNILLLHSQGVPRNEIARRVKRSPPSVSRVVHDAGLVFSDTRAAEASQIKAQRLKERREKLAEKLLGDAEQLREVLNSPHSYYVQGKYELLPVTLPRPPMRDIRDGMSAMATMLDQHNKLMASGNAERGMDEKRSVMGRLQQSIRALYVAENPDKPDPTAKPPKEDTEAPKDEENGT